MAFVPSSREILYALYGSWRLIFGDAQAAGYFGADKATCWRSFFAAVLVAPGHLLLLFLPGRGEAIDSLDMMLLHFLAYVITWAAFPVVMIQLAEPMGRQQQVWRFITAFNWAQVVIIALYLPIALLSVSGLIGEGGAAFIELLAALAVLGYCWQVSRLMLGISGIAAGGITFLALILEIAVSILLQGTLS
ncbi:hypothetical protein ACTL6U_10265 [Rhodovibrionaceae bacterium A322]